MWGTMEEQFDFCVVGGGMIGSALAIGLAKLGYKITIIEQHMPAAFSVDQAPDMRVSAINLASQTLLNQLDVWHFVVQMRLCPFKRMDVWDRMGGTTQFNATEIDSPYLGHIVENRVLQLALHQGIDSYDNICWYQGGIINSMELADNQALITLKNQQRIRANYLVGADGGNSFVRRQSGIGEQGWQYSQQALAIKIRTESGQQDITWQEFHPSGPRAFLPLFNGFGSLVWYDSSARIEALKNLNKTKLKQQIIEHFPDKLGDFEILELTSFPLTRMHANQYVKDQVLLIGDAAHTINPLAGQGVNLGFKDVAVLLDSLKAEAAQPSKAFKRYESERRKANLLMMSTMDAIYRLFSTESQPISMLRNLGLVLADKAGPIKKEVMKYAMGIK